MISVSDQNTDALNGKRPFEERVFARFDALDFSLRGIESRIGGVESRMQGLESSMQSLESRVEGLESRMQGLETRMEGVETHLQNVESRLQKLEVRAYDTKPIWEQALKEIVETRRDLSKRLARIEAVVYETRSDLRDVEDRLDKLENKPGP